MNEMDQVLLNRYREVRSKTESLCFPLINEDYVIQSVPEVSPPKWHLAHTSWFFETFILAQYLKDYEKFNPDFGFLFNSYYQGVGKFLARPLRGVLSRPPIEDIYRYRAHVDAAIPSTLKQGDVQSHETVKQRLELGIHHEQQHQELLLMDIKMNFWMNPLRPSYSEKKWEISLGPLDPGWIGFVGGVQTLGTNGPEFAFDNEKPLHSVLIHPFQMSSRLVTNGEFMKFIEAGGYNAPEFWLSDGWAAVQKNSWHAPLYWEKKSGVWQNMTFSGMAEIRLFEPVCHLSYYEADAFARWSRKRLPTESEWECAAQTPEFSRNFPDVHSVWEWTQSPYTSYPGFRPLQGELGEYNGKFMCNQMVLRGGSFATPQTHLRNTYRNFYPPEARWQFSGLRLAEDK